MSKNTIISVLTPTRGRPDLARRMYKSARETAANPSALQMLFYVDDDDPELLGYRTGSPVLGKLTVGPPVRVGAAWNALAASACGGLLMMGNDDLVFRTPGWDNMVRKATAGIPDGIFVAWCNDLSKRAAVRCAFPIVSRLWYNVLGHFAPECFHFLWHDTWVWDIGKRLGRELYIGKAVVEHCHFAFDKAPRDATYMRHRKGRENAMKRAADELTFTERAPEREASAAKLRERMK